MRRFSWVIMIYLALAICWWGLLLYNKNKDLYTVLINNTPSHEVKAKQILKDKYERQSIMIIGEGAVLLLSMLAGLYIINRSASRELSLMNKQNDFLLSVSHELKSPIAAIKLALQTLVKHNLNKHEKDKLLNRAVNDSDRLEKMVENVLMTANIDNNNHELALTKCNITDIIKSYISSVPMHADKINFNGNINESILGDPNALHLIISNLVENSIKYTSKQDVIITLNLSTDQNQVILDIKDNGHGIPKKERSQVFDRFYRVNNSNNSHIKGSGLGLYIVKSLLDQHKARITLFDNKPTGTHFQIKFPVFE